MANGGFFLKAKRGREIPVNLPDIPGLHKPSLSDRCRVHADNMQSEGWYTTANVLDEAAQALDQLNAPATKSGGLHMQEAKPYILVTSGLTITVLGLLAINVLIALGVI